MLCTVWVLLIKSVNGKRTVDKTSIDIWVECNQFQLVEQLNRKADRRNSYLYRRGDHRSFVRFLIHWREDGKTNKSVILSLSKNLYIDPSITLRSTQDDNLVSSSSRIPMRKSLEKDEMTEQMFLCYNMLTAERKEESGGRNRFL